MVRSGLADGRIFNGIKPSKLDLQGGMIVYITGPKGAGKTTLISHLAGEQMLPPISDIKVYNAAKEAYILKQQGYKYADIPPEVQHLVYADIKITTCKDQGYLPRKEWKLDIDRMKIPTEKDKDVTFYPRGAVIVIDELMEKFDSRDWNKKDSGMPATMRKFLQICRHRDISVITGCLLASASDKRFRSMSNNILLIVDRKDTFKKDKVVKTVWYCLEFPNTVLCDKYLDTKNTTFARPMIFEHKGNIYNYVDSYSENKQFIKGLEDRRIEFNARNE